jgi:hypothetical protein
LLHGEAELPVRQVPSGVQAYTLRPKVPWDRLADFLRGVIMPLHGDGATLDVEITLQARAPDGIKRSTLEQKVNETLS